MQTWTFTAGRRSDSSVINC